MRKNTIPGGEHLASQPGQGRHVSRGGRRRIIEQFAQHPDPALHRAGMFPVAAHGQDGGHAEQPTPVRILRQAHLAEGITVDALDPIVVGESRVADHVVGLE